MSERNPLCASLGPTNMTFVLTYEPCVHISGAVWIQGSSGLKVPESAVVLGKGEAHTSIYVGSVLHEGKRVLAQVHPSKKAAYFHRHGQDVEMLYYKVSHIMLYFAPI